MPKKKPKKSRARRRPRAHTDAPSLSHPIAIRVPRANHDQLVELGRERGSDVSTVSREFILAGLRSGHRVEIMERGDRRFVMRVSQDLYRQLSAAAANAESDVSGVASGLVLLGLGARAEAA